VLEDGPAGLIRSADPVSILNILLSDAASEAKVQSLMDDILPPGSASATASCHMHSAAKIARPTGTDGSAAR